MRKKKVKEYNESFLTVVKRLFKCVREFKVAAILSPIFITCEVIMECIIPFFIGEFIDQLTVINSSGVVGTDVVMPVIIKYALILLPLALGSLTFGLLSGKFCAYAGVGFSRNIRHDMFERIQTYSFENIDKYATSGLVTRMTTDVFFVQMAFMNLIRIAVRGPLMLLFSLVMAFIKAPTTAWIFLIVIPILAFGLAFVMLRAHPIFKRVFKEYDALNDSVEENIKGIRVVKAFVRAEEEKEKFRYSSGKVEANFIKAEKIFAFINPIMQLSIYLVIILLTFFGGKDILEGIRTQAEGLHMTTGDYNALLVYGIQCLFALMGFSQVILTIVMSVESSHRIYEVLNEETTIKNCENPIYEIPDGSVVFEDVNFKYAGSAEIFSLKNINLNIKSGETIGIIGSTGSSKTTLVNLLSRLYEVTSGSVKVGGIDVRNYDLATLRDGVSVVLQKNVLFSGTIKENLKWGNKDATDEEVERAAKLACADEFVRSFPDGYDHKIEQGGTNVSGGQKQRLCIARALLKKPKILVLDDSTSAVDTKTDARIRKAFREEIPEVTKFIIAQRISSVMDSDRIIVMNNGYIDGIGTHEELLKNNLVYQECYYSQTKNGGDE